jgi:hypothetical protein
VAAPALDVAWQHETLPDASIPSPLPNLV